MHSFGLNSIDHSDLCCPLTSYKGTIEGSKGDDVGLGNIADALVLLLSKYCHNDIALLLQAGMDPLRRRHELFDASNWRSIQDQLLVEGERSLVLVLEEPTNNDGVSHCLILKVFRLFFRVTFSLKAVLGSLKQYDGYVGIEVHFLWNLVLCARTCRMTRRARQSRRCFRSSQEDRRA